MRLNCFHCGQVLAPSTSGNGLPEVCPRCDRSVRAAEPSALDSLLLKPWWSNSTAGLVSLIFHTAVVIMLALAAYQGPRNLADPDQEVTLAELPLVSLTDSSDESLQTNLTGVEAESGAVEVGLDVVAPPQPAANDLAIEVQLASPSSIGLSGGSTSIGFMGQGASGAAGAGASFMGVQARGSRFCIVADCSGSMKGRKIVHLKDEVKKTLGGLKQRGWIQVCFFYQHAWPYPERRWLNPRTEEDKIHRWLGDILAAGGTNPVPAFEEVAKLEPQPDAIFFMTDGLFEPRAAEQILKLFAGKNVVIHTITFMNRKSATAMQRIATTTGGKYRHVSAFE